jgi:hypothetical protein
MQLYRLIAIVPCCALVVILDIKLILLLSIISRVVATIACHIPRAKENHNAYKFALAEGWATPS